MRLGRLPEERRPEQHLSSALIGVWCSGVGNELPSSVAWRTRHSISSTGIDKHRVNGGIGLAAGCRSLQMEATIFGPIAAFEAARATDCLIVGVSGP